MSATIEITRYPNRRLYDRSQKKYVNVGDIEAMILDGKNVRVADNQSGEDITRMMLIQIILERHPERLKMFPVAFLHEMLRADSISLEWLTTYFGQAQTLLESFTRNPTGSLIPGFDFWRSFLPGGSTNEDLTATPSDSPSEEHSAEHQAGGGDALEVQDGENQTRDADPLVSHASQELAKRLARLELRLKELEGRHPGSSNSTNTSDASRISEKSDDDVQGS